MAIGPKRNEGGTVTGVRPGTRAQARYVRVSAYKAREVLNLVRGLDVKRADEVLQFTDRSVADDVRKVLASAVANAVNNDAQDAEELFVLACFADEGPTLKRFTPRARGRAGRIRKRTCHITVVVERMSDEQLARKAAKEAGRGGAGGNRARRVAASTGGAASRRDRVAASRSARAGDVNDSIEEATSDDAAQVTTEGETVQAFADTFVAEPYGSGSASANADGSQPEGYDIKGNADSMLYHVPGSRFYDQTIAEVWFATEEAAEAAGFAKPASQRKNNGEDGADVTDGEDA